MKHKPVRKGLQKFSPEYIEQTRGATTEQILEFLEQMRLLQGAQDVGASDSVLISLRLDRQVLAALKARAAVENTKYQTLIKKLIRDYLGGR
ncbi:MAG: hypothetical protein COT73_01630 [Bdellovibrio sp. CG10_big_fil_rev_8_21_14_0_10_47_8]|nr:MAG: hypothetical protein COT73_01630 [Bdellovibrio sp. CG10_big_fil_rev_8_21_14_0_10_47_8]